MPMVVNHPTDENGKPCSARSPDILSKFGIGQVYQATTANGKLDGLGYFDVEKSQKLIPNEFSRLERGEVIELSTGLYTDNYPIENDEEAEFNGKSYKAINIIDVLSNRFRQHLCRH